MRRRDVLLGSGAVLVLAILGGCSKQLPTYRYRLTVEVDTPAGLRSGSSVIEVHTVDQGRGFPGPEAGGIRHDVRGEAVAVDVAPGQTLFALLSSDYSVDWANNIMFILAPAAPQVGGEDDFGRRFDLMLGNRKPIVLPRRFTGPEFRLTTPAAYPIMVRFRDIRDPRTVEKVDPDDLAKSFGPGIRLKRIVAQITDDAVTEEIARRLPWIDRLAKFRTQPDNPFSSNLPTEIGYLRSGRFARPEI